MKPNEGLSVMVSLQQANENTFCQQNYYGTAEDDLNHAEVKANLIHFSATANKLFTNISVVSIPLPL